MGIPKCRSPVLQVFLLRMAFGELTFVISSLDRWKEKRAHRLLCECRGPLAALL